MEIVGWVESISQDLKAATPAPVRPWVSTIRYQELQHELALTDAMVTSYCWEPEISLVEAGLLAIWTQGIEPLTCVPGAVSLWLLRPGTRSPEFWEHEAISLQAISSACKGSTLKGPGLPTQVCLLLTTCSFYRASSKGHQKLIRNNSLFIIWNNQWIQPLIKSEPTRSN